LHSTREVERAKVTIGRCVDESGEGEEVTAVIVKVIAFEAHLDRVIVCRSPDVKQRFLK